MADRLLLLALLLSVTSPAAWAQDPAGAEFQVNSYTTGTQRLPTAAGVGTAGDFVVAWSSYLQDGNSEGVFGQRFAWDGTKRGAEFLVNSYTTNTQFLPTVAGVGTAGDFVVAWMSNNQDGNSEGVFGQRFASDGTKQGAEFQVNSFTTNYQGRPTVASVGTAGDFVVAWNSYTQDGSSFGVFGQRFASDGTKQGAEFQVNSNATNLQRDPTVAGVGTAGDFVVAWMSNNQDGNNWGVFGQRFASDGTKQGAEFQVNAYTTSSQSNPTVAGVGTAGDFVVGWQSDAQDGSGGGVFGQRFASAGTKQGAEFQVNSYTTSSQSNPTVAGVGTAGDFVVAWESYNNQDGSGGGVFGQRYGDLIFKDGFE